MALHLGEARDATHGFLILSSSRVDLGVLVTHHYKLDDIVAAYDLFSHQRDGVLKVAIKP